MDYTSNNDLNETCNIKQPIVFYLKNVNEEFFDNINIEYLDKILEKNPMFAGESSLLDLCFFFVQGSGNKMYNRSIASKLNELNKVLTSP